MGNFNISINQVIPHLQIRRYLFAKLNRKKTFIRIKARGRVIHGKNVEPQRDLIPTKEVITAEPFSKKRPETGPVGSRYEARWREFRIWFVTKFKTLSLLRFILRYVPYCNVHFCNVT